MRVDDIRKILVVGAGTMGGQIALQCAMHGYQVNLFDSSEAVLQTVHEKLGAYGEGLVASGRLSQDQATAALGRIHVTADPRLAADADLLSESVPEDPALKGQVLAQFNDLCPPHTIFTTNASSLVPSMFAEATGRPSQFAALHFHSDVWDANVVDVMPHAGTAPAVVQLLCAFARRIGQIPILLEKENYGYVFNAMYNALNRAALTLAARGVAAVEDIDRAWMGVMKMPIGPFGMLDHVGLDTAWGITHYWAQILGDAELIANAAFLKGYLDQGYLGAKSGRGFYTYPDPAYQRPNFVGGGQEGEGRC